MQKVSVPALARAEVRDLAEVARDDVGWIVATRDNFLGQSGRRGGQKEQESAAHGPEELWKSSVNVNKGAARASRSRR